jgi:hypothetical protein
MYTFLASELQRNSLYTYRQLFSRLPETRSFGAGEIAQSIVPMGEKSEKSKKSRTPSFLALAISHFNSTLFAHCLMEAVQSRVL